MYYAPLAVVDHLATPLLAITGTLGVRALLPLIAVYLGNRAFQGAGPLGYDKPP